MSVQRPYDVSIWNNQDNTWQVTWLTDRAAQVFKQQYGVYAFKVHDSEVLRVLILCWSNDFHINFPLDIVLTTLMDLEGKPIKDPKMPNSTP